MPYGGAARYERGAVGGPGPGQSALADPLGTDRLRRAIHRQPKIPHRRPSCPVSDFHHRSQVSYYPEMVRHPSWHRLSESASFL